MAIRKPTETFRSTVTQSIRCVLTPEEGASVGIRKVQVLVPSSPPVYALLAPSSQFLDEHGVPLRDLAAAAGLDRVYKGMLLTPGAQIVFHVFPDQSLWAGCEISYAELGIIVEYLKGDL